MNCDSHTKSSKSCHDSRDSTCLFAASGEQAIYNHPALSYAAASIFSLSRCIWTLLAMFPIPELFERFVVSLFCCGFVTSTAVIIWQCCLHFFSVCIQPIPVLFNWSGSLVLVSDQLLSIAVYCWLCLHGQCTLTVLLVTRCSLLDCLSVHGELPVWVLFV